MIVRFLASNVDLWPSALGRVRPMTTVSFRGVRNQGLLSGDDRGKRLGMSDLSTTFSFSTAPPRGRQSSRVGRLKAISEANTRHKCSGMSPGSMRLHLVEWADTAACHPGLPFPQFPATDAGEAAPA